MVVYVEHKAIIEMSADVNKEAHFVQVRMGEHHA